MSYEGAPPQIPRPGDLLQVCASGEFCYVLVLGLTYDDSGSLRYWDNVHLRILNPTPPYKVCNVLWYDTTLPKDVDEHLLYQCQ